MYQAPISQRLRTALWEYNLYFDKYAKQLLLDIVKDVVKDDPYVEEIQADTPVSKERTKNASTGFG